MTRKYIRMTRRRLTGLAVLLIGLSMSAAVSAQQARQALSSDSVIETIKERGAIKIGLSLFTPWSMRDKKGELIGFELEPAARQFVF